MTRPRLAAVALLSALALAGCGGGSPEAGGDVNLSAEAISRHGSATIGAGDRLVVELAEDYFAPTVITAPAGRRVTLVLVNDGHIRHNFSLYPPGIDRDVAPGRRVTVSFTLPAGRSEYFFCKYHSNLGMGGILVAG